MSRGRRSSGSASKVSTEAVITPYDSSRQDAALFDSSVPLDEAVLGNMGDGLYTTDSEGRVLTMNPAAQRILGWQIDDVRGQHIHDLIHHSRRDGTTVPQHACTIDSVLRTGNAVYETDDEFIRRDGTFFDVRYTASALKDADKVTGLVVVFRDVSERLQSQRDQKFLFTIADRIRTATQADVLLAEVSQLVGRYLDVHRCLFNEIDLGSDTEVIHSDFSRTGDSVAGVHPLSDYSSVTSKIMMSGQTVVNRDSKTDPRTAELYAKTYEPNNERAYVTVPMLRDGKWVASLWCSDDKPRDWADREISLLENIAERTWSAVERVRAQEALIRSEERFRGMINQSVVGIAETDLSGHFISVNDRYCAIVGYTRDELLRMNMRDITNPADLAENLEKFRLLARDGKPFEIEKRYIHKSGIDVWVHNHVYALRDAAGKPRSIVAVSADITDRKRTERALSESEENYRTLFESIDEGFVIVEMIFDETGRPVDYRFIQANPAFSRLTGLPEDALGKTARELVPDLEEFWFETYGRVALTGEPARFEHRSEAMGRWFDVYASRIGQGSDHRVAIVFSNVTERKITENALRESEARFRHMADNAPVIIWMTDSTGSCTYLSQSWYDLTGQTPEAALGYGWLDSTHPDDKQQTEEAYLRANDGREPFDLEYRLRAKDGSYRWVIDSAQPRFNKSGEFRGHIGSVVDITSRKEAEDKLRESEERFQLAQSAGSVGVWDWDLEAGRTYWSDTMWRFYGEEQTSVNPDEAFWSLHLHPEDRERVKENLDRTVLSDDLYYRDEFRIIGAEGRTIWIESMANVVRRADGKAARIYGVNVDITERKLNEERIKRNETQLRLVTDSLPALIAYIDKRKRYQFVNGTYSEWFGSTPAEIVGKTVREVLGRKAYPTVKPLIERALAGETVSIHTEVEYEDIGTKFIHLNYVPDVSEDGHVRGFFSLINDFTEIRRSEELLRSTEDRIALLMENVTDYAIFSVNTDGIVESWNTGAERIFGYSASEMIGRPGDILFTAEDIARGVHLNEMRAARQKGRATDERWYLRKDGSRFFANVVMMPSIVGQRLTGYAKIAGDLTERKRRAEALQSAHDELELRVFQRTKELAETNELLRTEIEQRNLSEQHRVKLLHRIVSAQEAERKRIARDIHDQLGQRLTALRLKLASLRDVTEGNENVTARVERLQEIAALLDSEVSFLASELRPSILDDLGLEEALRAYSGEWSSHFDIKVGFHSNGVIGKRFGREVETQLYRIAQEALNNVAKHAGVAEVTVLMEQTADFLVLIVEDTGKGFELTTRLKRSDRGLGLVGMRERATLIGAELEVESAPGQGTTIFLRLPNKKRGQRNGR